MLNVSGSMSTKTGVAPTLWIGPGGGEEGERRRDDFVAAANVERPHRQQERVGAVGAADGVLRVRKCGDRGLELLDRRPG